MKKFWKHTLLALALALSSSTYVHAETASVAYNGTLDQVITFLFGWLIGNNHPQERVPTPAPPKTPVAPEIDPDLAVGAVLLLGGSLAVLRSRRRS